MTVEIEKEPYLENHNTLNSSLNEKLIELKKSEKDSERRLKSSTIRKMPDRSFSSSVLLGISSNIHNSARMKSKILSRSD